MNNIEEIIIPENYSLIRIDKALTLFYPNYTRTYFSYLIKNKKVKINDKYVSPSYIIKPFDKVDIEFEEKEGEEIIPLKMSLDIVYEDEDLLIINKPKGLVVHPSNGHENDTLVNALIYNNKELSNVNGKYRVGIVHRIDKDTSGLLLICKNDFTHNEIAKQLKDHTMNREYYALCDGNILENYLKIIGKIGRDKNNRLKMAINTENGKEAITHVTVIERYFKYTLVQCKLETGRTHQIRVHLSSIKHPLVGDSLYGGSTVLYNNGQLLHAYKLSFIHPRTLKNMSFEIPLPDYFSDVLSKLK